MSAFSHEQTLLTGVLPRNFRPSVAALRAIWREHLWERRSALHAVTDIQRTSVARLASRCLLAATDQYRKHLRGVDPSAYLLAAPEVGAELRRHVYRFACTRVAANSRASLLDDEGTEPTEFDTVTPRQTFSNRLEDGVDDALRLAVDEVWVLLCQSQYEL